MHLVEETRTHHEFCSGLGPNIGTHRYNYANNGNRESDGPERSQCSLYCTGAGGTSVAIRFIAIREAGLWNSLMEHAGYEGEDCITSDKHGRAFMSIKPVDEGVPQRSEIDHKQLSGVMIIVYSC